MTLYSIDTIRLAIPVSSPWIDKLEEVFSATDRWHWCRYNPTCREIWLASVSAEIKPKSWHKNVYVTLRDQDGIGKAVVVEFSLPKAVYGNNVGLVPWWLGHLQHLGGALEKYLIEWADPHKLMDSPIFDEFDEWKILRLDCAWAWRLESQERAEALLESLKRGRFKWRSPIVYETGILYPNKQSPCKFYLKKPEFIRHDLKKLSHDPATDMDLLPSLLTQVNGVLRFELTLRGKALREVGVYNLGDVNSVCLGDTLREYLDRCTSLEGLYLSESLLGSRLLEHFSRAKAGRLLDFCRVLRAEGEAFALHRYGVDAFYRNKRDLRLILHNDMLAEDPEWEKLEGFNFANDVFDPELKPIQMFIFSGV